MGAILEATVTILLLGLILAHATQFSTAIQAVGNVYTSSVKALSQVAG